MKLDRLILTVLLFTTTCLSAETIVANSEQIVFNSHKQLYTTKTPIQTGIARRSEPINLPGLYNISNAISFDPTGATELTNSHGEVVQLEKAGQRFSVYNAGQRLPIFKLGSSWYSYVRPLNDLYTNRNFLWAGDITIQNSSGLPTITNATQSEGWINNDGVNALIDSDGNMTKIFRVHYESNLNTFISSRASATILPYGPVWRNGLITSKKTQNVSLGSQSIDVSKNAKVVYAIYDHTNINNELRSLNIKIGDSGDTVVGTYRGSGEFVFTAEFPASHLAGKSTASFEITGSTGAEFYSDFIEVYLPVLPGANGYELSPVESYNKKVNNKYTNPPKYLITKVDSSYLGSIKINGANVAVGLGTKAGEEVLLSLSSGELTDRQSNEYIFFTEYPIRASGATTAQGFKYPDPLTFEPSKQLSLIDASGKDYVYNFTFRQ